MRLVCPSCRSALAPVAGGHRCASCAHEYRDVEGIPILLPTTERALPRSEREYWDARFAAEGDAKQLAAAYAAPDFFADAWGLLAYVERILERMPRGSRILEIGTGLGSQAIPLALHHGFRAVVTDVSACALALNRDALAALGGSPAVEYHVADADHLPYEDGSFDVVLLHAALHHLPEPRSALREASRCLRPGGLLVLGYEPNRRVFAPLRRLAGALRLTEKHSRRLVPDRYSVADDETPGFFARELRAWVEESGLALEWMEPVWLVAALVYHLPALSHVLLRRWFEVPDSLRRSARRLDKRLFAVLPPARQLCFAWSLGAAKREAPVPLPHCRGKRLAVR